MNSAASSSDRRRLSSSMSGSSPDAAKKAFQSRRPLVPSRKCWRPAASDSTPSRSKTAAATGPSGGPSRQVQLSGEAKRVSVLLGRARCSAADLVDDGGVGQRGGVTEVVPLGDVLQESPHDLAAPRLGQIGREDDRLWPRQRPELLR